jgi:hypothetical protein
MTQKELARMIEECKKMLAKTDQALAESQRILQSPQK